MLGLKKNRMICKYHLSRIRLGLPVNIAGNHKAILDLSLCSGSTKLVSNLKQSRDSRLNSSAAAAYLAESAEVG